MRKNPQYIDVDLDAISTVAHHCSGCTHTDACCCAVHEVCVNKREMNTIIGALPLAARYCPGLENRDGFDNVFDEVDRGVFAIDTCTLWPLVMRSPPDAALSICDDALQFPCNRKVKAGRISPELLDSLDKLLGTAVCGQILKGAQAGHKRARLQLPFPFPMELVYPVVKPTRKPVTINEKEYT